jgi:hypothetical protein
MVVQGDKLDVNSFRPDVFLDCGRTFVVHYVQCRMVAAGFQYGDDFGECLYHGSIGGSARWHGPDNDCIKIVDVGNKHIFHNFERADREGTSDVGIHGAHYGIGKHSKAEHILHSTDFLRGKHAINLGMCGNNAGLRVEVVLAWCRCLCPLLVAVERGRLFLINVVMRPVIVVCSSLRFSAQRSVDAGGEHMIWCM